MMIDERRNIILDYFKSKENLKNAGSASGLLSSTELTKLEISSSDILYNTLYDCLIEQSIRIPKHSHESVMEDFDSKFGEDGDENIIKIATINKTNIDMAKFKKIAEKSEVKK